MYGNPWIHPDQRLEELRTAELWCGVILAAQATGTKVDAREVHREMDRRLDLAHLELEHFEEDQDYLDLLDTQRGATQ